MLREGAKKVLDDGRGVGRSGIRPLMSDHSSAAAHGPAISGAEVTACDIDEVVLSHPCSHRQVLISPKKALPFADGEFDVIVSDMTFEHIEDPQVLATELLRVLRPGGIICARTPNRYGYVKIVAQLVPNRLHTRALRSVQPLRKTEDVFPTTYKLNSIGQVKRYFTGCEIVSYTDSAEPSYYFNNSLLYRALLVLHRLLPPMLATNACIFIRKAGSP